MKVNDAIQRSAEAPESGEPPTEPIDYGTLNAAFGALLTALAVAGRHHPDRVAAALEPRDLPLVFAATFAVSKAITRERIGVWVREPFVEEEEEGEDSGRRPRGRGLRHAVGEVLTCSRCAGVWGALGIVGLRMAAPNGGQVATGVLATAAANDFLQAAFRLLTERTNIAESRAAVSARRAEGTQPT